MVKRRKNQHSEIKLKGLRLLSVLPKLLSRQPEESVGTSNGSAYYVRPALVEKGLVKLANINRKSRSRQFSYFLTPKEIREKSILKHRFIMQKRQDCKGLKAEVEALEDEVGLASGAVTEWHGEKV